MRNFFEAVSFSPRIRESFNTLKTKVEAQGVSQRTAQELSILKLTFGIETVAQKFSLRREVGEIIENRLEWQLAKEDQSAQGDQKLAAIVNGVYRTRDMLLRKKAGFLEMNSNQSVIFYKYLDGHLNKIVKTLYERFPYLKLKDDPNVRGGVIEQTTRLARQYQAFEERFWKFDADTPAKRVKNRGLQNSLTRLSLAGLVAGSSLLREDLPQQLPANATQLKSPALASKPESFTQKVVEQYWGSFWTVKEGETINEIAQIAYPNFAKDPLYYINKILRAHRQTKEDIIFPGETLYIPSVDPNAPQPYGFVAGEEIRFEGELLATKIVAIDVKRNILQVYYNNTTFEMPLQVGKEFATNHRFRIVAILPAIPNQPARVDLEIP